MAKMREMSDHEAFNLRQDAQVATLQSLLNSRRWEPGDLIFHGGTSLHLVHGSPRFSEDLDFMVSSSINTKDITSEIINRMPGGGWLKTLWFSLSASVMTAGCTHSSFLSGGRM